jgi:hypothetical protein
MVGMYVYRSDRESCLSPAKIDGATSRIWSSESGVFERRIGALLPNLVASCMVFSSEDSGSMRVVQEFAGVRQHQTTWS